MSIRRFFLRIIFLCLLLVPLTAFCSEVVGILPFSNQRPNSDLDWLGFYMQARVEANLRDNSTWEFHPLSVLRLWNYKSKISQPVTSRNTILISGSFQQVLHFGYLRVRVRRIQRPDPVLKKFEIEYTDENLNEKLDSLSAEIGQWIRPEFKLLKTASFPAFNLAGIKELCQYRRLMFRPTERPEIRHTLHLQDLLSSRSPREMIADVAEGLIILSQGLKDREQKSLLDLIERLLRNATIRYMEDSRLYALLAETYYFKQMYAAWIEKTAKNALKFDPHNDLALILLIAVADFDSEQVTGYIDKLKEVNPWLWGSHGNKPILFQKGILESELRAVIQKGD